MQDIIVCVCDMHFVMALNASHFKTVTIHSVITNSIQPKKGMWGRDSGSLCFGLFRHHWSVLVWYFKETTP